MRSIVAILLSCLCTVSWAVHGQVKQYYHKDPQGLLESQSSIIFNKVYEVLESFPPDTVVSNNRKLALFALDGLYHDTRLDTSIAMQNHFGFVVNRTLKAFNHTTVEEGIQVLKIYNHGFILRSRDVTVAIDLVRGTKKAAISDRDMQRLVDKVDILFITHSHGDHADKVVAGMFARQSKPVILPPNLWEGESKNYHYLRQVGTPVDKQFTVSENRILEVKSFPGYQGDMPNNIYAITFPDGIVVTHTGDQANKDDLSWIQSIKNEIKTDVLLLHCWMPNMKETIDGIQPRLIITGHENELGHTIDHREPYWLAFEKMNKINIPYIIMACGENYMLQK